MRVLDLDLDFFLSDCCPLALLGERPMNSCAQHWSAQRVEAFLTDQCGLSKDKKTPGRVFETHDGALDFWQEQLTCGSLSAPFDVVHVDAHSDLAFGKPGPSFVLKAVLTRLPEERPSLYSYRDGKKLDEANYLLFALAFRWISSLKLVRNPHSHKDVSALLLDDQGNIHLSSDVAAIMQFKNGSEPTVPFTIYDDYALYKENDFDYVSLAHSPRYAPEDADELIPVIMRYIQSI